MAKRKANNQKSIKRIDQIPLYQGAPSIKWTFDANQGLLFNKWIKWSMEAEDGKEPKQTEKPLQLEFDKKKFVQDWMKKKVGKKSFIDGYQKRIRKLVKRLNGITFEMKTMDRLVTGMSLPHPLENNLVWHHTLGVPFLPGSSIKGMLRAWLETWKSLDQAILDHVFGSEAQTGNCLFFDAIPIDVVKLQADVMTPHFQAYYSGVEQGDEANRNPDKDTHPYPDERSNPIPIPFLTVAPEQTFLFALAPRRDTSKLNLKQIQLWLEEALCTVGFGAKTAVGYGRFKRKISMNKDDSGKNM